MDFLFSSIFFFPVFFHTFFQFMAIEASRGPEDANEQVFFVGMRWQHTLAYCSCRGVGEEAALSSFFCLLHVYKFSSITNALRTVRSRTSRLKRRLLCHSVRLVRACTKEPERFSKFLWNVSGYGPARTYTFRI
jgi:hypothetical protein